MSRGKRWYIGYSRTLWVPVSIEGWLLTIVFVCGLYFIYALNGVSGDVPFQITVHWPMIVEMVGLITGFYWLSKGHVDKRY